MPSEPSRAETHASGQELKQHEDPMQSPSQADPITHAQELEMLKQAELAPMELESSSHWHADPMQSPSQAEPSDPSADAQELDMLKLAPIASAQELESPNQADPMQSPSRFEPM